MTPCETTRGWLLASPDELAPEVSQHVARCEACRETLARLNQIDQFARGIAPADASAGLEKLLTRLDEEPAAPALQAWAGWLPAERAARFVLAASLLAAVGLGWLLGRWPSTSAGPSQAVDYANLVTRAVEHDLQLSAAQTPDDRARVMLALSEDLRREMFRAAEQGQPDLEMLAALYQQTLAGGLDNNVRSAPADRRAALEAELAAALEHASREAQQLAPRLSSHTGAQVSLVGESARTAVDRWRRSHESPASETPVANGALARPETMLAMLVTRGSAIRSDADAVELSEHSAELAEQLMSSIVSASDQGQTEWAQQLSQQLPAVADRAAANLKVADAAVLSAEKRADLDRIAEQFDASTRAMEQKLERLPAPARAGIQRAIEASRFGRERAAQARQGHPAARAGGAKGPPGKAGGPPGLRKGKGADSDDQDEARREAKEQQRERIKERDE